jgi:hypothetical protein
MASTITTFGRILEAWSASIPVRRHAREVFMNSVDDNLRTALADIFPISRPRPDSNSHDV